MSSENEEVEKKENPGARTMEVKVGFNEETKKLLDVLVENLNKINQINEENNQLLREALKNSLTLNQSKSQKG